MGNGSTAVAEGANGQFSLGNKISKQINGKI